MKSLIIIALAAGSAFPQRVPVPATPITGSERMAWIVTNTLGVPTLGAVALTAGFDTWIDTPTEYDTHWKGFGQRFGIRISGVAVGNVMEAGLGAIDGEDPRYSRAPEGTSFGGRVGRIVKWTFVAPRRDGELHPAYARYLAIAGSSAVQNIWLPDSQSTVPQFMERTGLGFLSHAAGNTWTEFWPDAKRKLFRR